MELQLQRFLGWFFVELYELKPCNTHIEIDISHVCPNQTNGNKSLQPLEDRKTKELNNDRMCHIFP